MLKKKSVLFTLIAFVTFGSFIDAKKQTKKQKKKGDTYSRIKKKVEGSIWYLKSYTQQKDVLENSMISLNFDSKQKNISGSAGCNNYSSTYKINNNKISIGSKYSLTRKYCYMPIGVMDQENSFNKLIQSAKSFTIKNGNLIIYCKDNQRLVFTTAKPKIKKVGPPVVPLPVMPAKK